MKHSFLVHFKKVLPSSFNRYFPKSVKTDISHEDFNVFVKKVFDGPADEKIKAFMMPDIFVAWFQHMSKVLPKGEADQSNVRHKRDVSPNDMDAQVQRLLARELFDTSQRKKHA